MILNIAITLSVFLMMESAAWFTHKYIMHGFLWFLHKDHHVKTKPDAVVEKNDSFFLIFALPAILLFASWSFWYLNWALYVAIGITLYGLAYFFVHDIFIHQRIKVLRDSNNRYLKAIRRAHKMHHKHLTKEQGECFGMLWVPLIYFKEAFKK